MSKRGYEESLPVGIVQTTLNCARAWEASADRPSIAASEDARAWGEICRAMRTFQDDAGKPKLIVLPELSLPRTRLDDFEHLVASLNVIAVAGADYRLDLGNLAARNEGVVFVPQNFFRDHPSRHCARVLFGKSFPSPDEYEHLDSMTPQWRFLGDHTVYLFNCEEYGTFGVSICIDFMDLERALLYRGKVQHLFVLAYNRDLEMFRSLAHSLSRTVFCNVLICNTGYYGGSLTVSPYFESHKRVSYGHDGQRLFTTQVVQLPVKKLVGAQRRRGEFIVHKREKRPLFKDPPPGFTLSVK